MEITAEYDEIEVFPFLSSIVTSIILPPSYLLHRSAIVVALVFNVAFDANRLCIACGSTSEPPLYTLKSISMQDCEDMILTVLTQCISILFFWNFLSRANQRPPTPRS